MLEIFDDREKNSDRAPSPPRTFAYADSRAIRALSRHQC